MRKKLPPATEVLGNLQAQPQVQERETVEDVLQVLQDPAERLAFTLWTHNPTQNLAQYQSYLQTAWGVTAPNLVTLNTWFLQHDWKALQQRWTQASGYPHPVTTTVAKDSLEGLEDSINRMGRSTESLVAIVEKMINGGGPVKTKDGVMEVPPLRINGSMSELKSITDILKTFGDKTEELIKEWRKERQEQEREEAGAWSQIDPATMCACFMIDVVNYTPPINVLREMGVDESVIEGVMKEQERLPTNQVDASLAE